MRRVTSRRVRFPVFRITPCCLPMFPRAWAPVNWLVCSSRPMEPSTRSASPSSMNRIAAIRLYLRRLPFSNGEAANGPDLHVYTGDGGDGLAESASIEEAASVAIAAARRSRAVNPEKKRPVGDRARSRSCWSQLRRRCERHLRGGRDMENRAVLQSGTRYV